jgi:hypothetical protein
MRMRVKRGKRGTSFTFEADSDKEGKDLKDALLEAVTAGKRFDLAALLNGLEQRGYGVEEKRDADPA